MSDVIMYQLPDGTFIMHDLERVLMIPSDGGRVKFYGSNTNVLKGEFRVASSLVIYQVAETKPGVREVVGSNVTIELEATTDESSRGND